jgi:hypothetical protein
MSVTEECVHLLELIEKQEPLLVEVAEGGTKPEDADGAYQETHWELRALLEALEIPCYCDWPNVHGWHGYTLTVGDPEWREWLALRTSQYRETLATHEKGPPPFRFVPYERRGDRADLPFEAWRNRLDEYKRLALDTGLNVVLAYEGPGVADDRRVGKWIKSGGKNVLEFKIRHNGKSIKTADGRGCPYTEISLRVWCRVQNNEILLLHGHDKGADVNGQDAAIETAFARLKEHEAREERAAAKRAKEFQVA